MKAFNYNIGLKNTAIVLDLVDLAKWLSFIGEGLLLKGPDKKKDKN